MMAHSRDTQNPSKPSFAVDIGSTMIKVAQVDECGNLQGQNFFPRDFDLGILRQFESLLAKLKIDTRHDEVTVCSSANGGLRVGIVCLTKHFSGAALQNQVLLAGANPVFVHEFDEVGGDLRRVDILLVGGGIDCTEADHLVQRLEAFDSTKYNYGRFVYAGNAYLAESFRRRFPGTSVIANPLSNSLHGRVGSVFEAVRRAYLDDLVLKEGVNEVQDKLSSGIRPTPEVVSRGFLRAAMHKSSFTVVGASLILDVGGATTDLHYAVELIREDSEAKPASGVSVGRFVFTDLGIVASRDTLLTQLRTHPRLYDFLGAVFGDEVREVYSLLRENEFAASDNLLSYGCVFLALYRFTNGREPGLPVADLGLLSQVILTGGAVQCLDESVVLRVAMLLMPDTGPPPLIQIDHRYQIWVAGITWDENQVSS